MLKNIALIVALSVAAYSAEDKMEKSDKMEKKLGA